MWWRVFQSFSVWLSVLNWLVLASEIPAIGVIAKSITAASVTIGELLIIVFILLMLLGALLNAAIGDKLQKWSGISNVLNSVFRNFVVGAHITLICLPSRSLAAKHCGGFRGSIADCLSHTRLPVCGSLALLRAACFLLGSRLA
jgi:hypothetical protein